HRQRDDERCYSSVGDEQTVDQPTCGADRQRRGHDDDPAVVGRDPLRGQRGRPHRRQRDDRADRQVDAATGDHERHPDADHADDRGQSQHGHHVAEVDEPVARGDRADRAEQQQGKDQAEVAARRPGQQRRPAAASALRTIDPHPFGGTGTTASHATSPSITMPSTSCSVISLAGVSVSTRPLETTSTRSDNPMTSVISLDTSTTASPASASSRISSYSWARAPTSTPRVGSSSSSTLHSRSSHRASTTFCWLPPESVRTSRSTPAGRTSRSTRRSSAAERSAARSRNPAFANVPRLAIVTLRKIASSSTNA